MTHRVRLMTSGWAPPESGPAREVYLRENGKIFLSAAEAAIGAVVEILGTQEIPIARLTGDESQDVVHMDAVCLRWDELRAQFSAIVETDLREPIEAAVQNSMDALNFLEDTELCDAAHTLVHQAAVLRFGFLGCTLRMTDGGVSSDCPVRVAHQRWGLSPELVTEWVCSVCQRRFDSCVHIPDEEYEVVVERSDAGCSACLEPDCEHQHGETALVVAHQIAASIQALAIAMVARPRDPRARVVEMPITVPAESELYRRIEAGEGRCRECILPCTGFVVPQSLH
ncbi:MULTISPECIES: hypothetical protein [unclassified Microbacterium]|uniref:hypothetical protein n=1 Tax=unclassified Microbacterium TaxID=2609290 RepID=UPI0034663DBA